ncbi:MAG: transporter substrate-binding domain-containing protein [Gordonia sp. (in: high G+C Gram-positive bacteria)]|uniref:transporter substrate-binding domain-containing protein n=1 Tax=Gordonia sp. (in: high G+C Gram-positive bacteria) TaxID=84139 RepID=UPI003BB65326
MRTIRGIGRVAGLGVAVALVLGATACGSSGEQSAGTSSAGASGSTTTAPFDASALRSQLPESIQESGELRVGTNVPFAPMNCRDGERLVGFDIDLVQAIAELLELKVDVQERPFPSLIGGVENGRLDIAARGIFDTAAREEKVDMVTYLRVGTQWAVKAGSDIDPTDACGRKVGALAGTTQETTELPAKSKACTSLGEIDIVDFSSESAAFAALTSGRVDAVSADSCVRDVRAPPRRTRTRRL